MVRVGAKSDSNYHRNPAMRSRLASRSGLHSRDERTKSCGEARPQILSISSVINARGGRRDGGCGWKAGGFGLSIVDDTEKLSGVGEF